MGGTIEKNTESGESRKEKYSFSKLSAFHTCKHGYKLTYIDKDKGDGNAFSSYGSFVHSLMERYTKGTIDLWDLPTTFKLEFDSAVPEPFPSTLYCPNMKTLYYAQGLEFLETFKGYENRKILDIEEKFEQAIDTWSLVGVIDLVFEDETGRLVIEDYKSKSSFKNKSEIKKYARQLYLYSIYVKEKYGKYPDVLRFTLFRKKTYVDILFDEKGLEEAINWAKDTVNEIRECWVFSPTCEEFFSQHLCNHRHHCKSKLGGGGKECLSKKNKYSKQKPSSVTKTQK
jgi:hypothetical protein